MLYLEDFHVGDVFELGEVKVTEDEIISFGRAYDPQVFHTDLERAKESSFGGLVASGWHTASLFMRRYVEEILNRSAGEGSPGVDEMRFHRPVRPGDVLQARLTVLGVAPMLGRPGSGLVRPRCELVDGSGAVVFSMVLHSVFRRRAS
ncbi:MaoC family dehydratase [Streptantibioticus rubrisoli]|uniref:MaoC family dehydratase n=1 Tax=Streptantibioticus rubrisoli TaxID=1387313 RepID=A0ABT1P9L6_9ACTN|nr:MaoC family dehydratase [Streptantibioticus rubrisoli]MCQ4041491.1 MaoC family dehydratase [Streptantibioticus rubrisoli]